MREPDRYVPDKGIDSMYENKYGMFVRYESWQEVNDELVDLQIKYKELVDALGELYKGA